MRRTALSLLAALLAGCVGLGAEPDGGAGGPAVVSCDEGFGVSTDGRTCLPRGDCVARAHEEGGGCLCDHGFEPADGATCRPSCGERQHADGDRCVCDPLHQPSRDGTACIPLGSAVYPSDGAVTIAESSLRILNDANGDGALNPGEPASVGFDLLNTGSDPIRDDITALVRSDSPHVTWCGPYGSPATSAGTEPVALTFGACEPDALCPLSGHSFGVLVSPATPPGTVLTFTVDAPRAGLQHVGAGARFSLSVRKADAVLAVAETRAITGDSNGDGVLSPGESAALAIELVNRGTAAVDGGSHCAAPRRRGASGFRRTR